MKRNLNKSFLSQIFFSSRTQRSRQHRRVGGVESSRPIPFKSFRMKRQGGNALTAIQFQHSTQPIHNFHLVVNSTCNSTHPRFPFNRQFFSQLNSSQTNSIHNKSTIILRSTHLSIGYSSFKLACTEISMVIHHIKSTVRHTCLFFAPDGPMPGVLSLRLNER